MKTKRFFACVLSLVMIINLLPTFSMTVAAADISTSTASISVGQTELTEDTFYLCNGDVPTSDGADETNYNLYYDSTTSTLTLNNAVLTKENQSNTLMVPGGTIINVCGNNAINSGTGIQTTSNGDLVIDGTGMLSITSTTEGVLIPNTLSGNIEIKGSVNLTFGTHNAISNKNGNNTIGENAVINATNISYFLYSNAGDVTIQGNAKVTANRVINTASGNIRITDTSEVKIEGTDCECGLRTETGDIEISGTAKLITSTTKSGINTFGGDLLIGKNAVVSLTSQNADNGAAINFSSLAASVEGQQITVKGSLTINCVNAAIGISTPNATFELDGGSYNVTAANLGFIGTKENTKFIAKNNSTINIKATTAGIYMNSTSGNEVTIKDSKLTICGGAAGIIMICKGSPTFNNSDVEITASSYVSYTKPTLSYGPCRTIIAGENQTAATEITYENIETANYHGNKYVKITRASEHSGNPCVNCGISDTVDYIVEHYTENKDGSYTLADTEHPAGKIDDTVTATAKDYAGFSYNATKSIASGTLKAITSEDDVVTLKLYYDLPHYAVTVEGSYAEKSGSGSYVEGATVSIDTGSRSGYRFAGWTVSDVVTLDDASKASTTFTMPANAVSLIANWKNNSGGGGGTVLPDIKPDTKPETKPDTKPDETKEETIIKTETGTNSKGKEVVTTTTTKRASDGNVISVTEKTVIPKSSGTTSTTVTVKKDGEGKIASAKAAITKTVSTGNKATIQSFILSQIIEAAGTEDVTISMTVKDTDGKTKYSVKADAKDFRFGNKLYIYKYNTKTKEYTMVNAKTYTVSKAGNVVISMKTKAIYHLVDAKKAAKINKQILSTIKPKKSSATVKKGKSTTFTLSSKVNKENIKSITYTTSKKSVATVNKNGKVSAKKKGTATVKAKVTLKNNIIKTIQMKIKVK